MGLCSYMQVLFPGETLLKYGNTFFYEFGQQSGTGMGLRYLFQDISAQYLPPGTSFAIFREQSQRLFLLKLRFGGECQIIQLGTLALWYIGNFYLEVLNFSLECYKAAEPLLPPRFFFLTASKIYFFTSQIVYSLFLQQTQGSSFLSQSDPSKIFCPNCTNSKLPTCFSNLVRYLTISSKKVTLKKLFLKLVPLLKYYSVYLAASIGRCYLRSQVNILSGSTNLPSSILFEMESNIYFRPNSKFLGNNQKNPTCCTLSSLLNLTPREGVFLNPKKVSPEISLHSTTSWNYLSRVSWIQLLQLQKQGGIYLPKISDSKFHFVEPFSLYDLVSPILSLPSLQKNSITILLLSAYAILLDYPLAKSITQVYPLAFTKTQIDYRALFLILPQRQSLFGNTTSVGPQGTSFLKFESVKRCQLSKYKARPSGEPPLIAP